MRNETKIVTIFTILIVMLGGLFFYKNIKIVGNPPVFNTFSSTNQIISFGGDDVNIKVEPIVSNMPDLEKPIIINAKLSGEEKQKIIKKIQEIKDILKMTPNSFDNWIELGSYEKLAGDFDGTIDVWVYASKIAPLNIVPLNNLGNLYHYDLKNYPKAEEYFQKAIKTLPSDVNSYINLFDLYNLSYKQETSEAEKVLLEGLKNIPNQINFLVMLADYYENKNNLKNAIIYYEKAVEQAKKMNNKNLESEINQKISELKK